VLSLLFKPHAGPNDAFHVVGGPPFNGGMHEAGAGVEFERNYGLLAQEDFVEAVIESVLLGGIHFLAGRIKHAVVFRITPSGFIRVGPTRIEFI
jgi:hypothetical protein